MKTPRIASGPTRRHPEAPRFFQRGEGSGGECSSCSFVTDCWIQEQACVSRVRRLLARSLTRLKYAEFRDDATARG